MTVFSTLVRLAVLVLLLIQIMPHSFAGAQTTDTKEQPSQSALGVSPAIVEHALIPGQTVSFTLQVNNVTNFPLPVKGFVKDLRLQAENLKTSERSRLDASKWFTIEEPDFILQPRQIRIIKGTIQPPVDAVPGGHYATVFFQPLLPRDALSPSMAYVNTRVGVLAFLIIKGDIEQKSELAKPLMTSRLARHGPITFTFGVRNTGNVHLMPSGSIKVYDRHNRQVGNLAVPSGIILPETAKEYSIQWDPPSNIGEYRAVLEAKSGADVELERTTIIFWIFPWIEALLLILVLSALAVFIIKTKKRWANAWRVLRGNA